MMRSDAETVEAYLDRVPPARRDALTKLRRTILDELPDGYVEAMRWGMISYEVPLDTSGRTYNGQPLMVAALGNQKNHMALYLCGVHCMPDGAERLKRDFAAAGKKLDMGKACIRFRDLGDLDLPAIARCIASVTPAQFVAASVSARRKS